MKRSKSYGSRPPQSRDGKPVKNRDWETRVILTVEASTVGVPQADNLNTLSQEKTAAHPITKLTTLDAIAEGSLPSSSLARYKAYKLALIGSKEDPQSVAHTLAVFIRDLYLGSSFTTLH